MKTPLPWMLGVAAAVVCAGAAWSLSHHLSARQQTLLDQMLQLQRGRARQVHAVEPGIAAELALAGAASPAVTAPLAATAADDLAWLNVDVQTSERRWAIAQTEFAAIATQRLRLSYLYSTAAQVLVLVLVLAPLKRRRSSSSPPLRSLRSLR